MTGSEGIPPALVLSSLSCLLMILSQMPFRSAAFGEGHAYPTRLDAVIRKLRPALFVLPVSLGVWLLAQTSASGGSWVLAGACVGASLMAALVLPGRRGSKAVLAVLILGAAATGAALVSWPTMREHFSLLGGWQSTGAMGNSHSAGWVMIGRSAGIIGLASVILGMAFCMIRSLLAGRGSGGQEQARTVLWLGASMLAGLTLLSEGGLALPSSVMIAGFALGLLPHMMGHEQKTINGWPVAMIFGLVLLVLGLAKRLLEDPLCGCMLDDRIAHYLAGVVACGVFIWQGRCRRWWSSLLPMVVAAGALSLGEVAQEKLSTRQFDYGDMFYDTLGSITTWLAFGLVLWAGRVERRMKLSAMARERDAEAMIRRGYAGRREGLDRAAAGHARSAATPAQWPTAAGR